MAEISVSRPTSQHALANLSESHEYKYDRSTYLGRVRCFYYTFNMRNLFYTDKQMQAFAQHVKETDEQKKVKDAYYYKALFAVQSCYHPDTGEKIFLPFRMASYVPLNMAVTGAMLYPTSSLPLTLGLQLLNQVINSSVNAANANKSTRVSNEQMATAFVTACIASCGVVYATRKAFAYFSASRAPSFRAQGLTSVCAVSAASVLNVLLTNWQMTKGIDCKTKEGAVVGKSAIAGYTALAQVSASRVFTAVPVILLPALVLARLPLQSPLSKGVASIGLVGFSLWGALPLALAVFDQTSSIATSNLEKSFQNLQDSQGMPITRLYFNKGL